MTTGSARRTYSAVALAALWAVLAFPGVALAADADADANADAPEPLVGEAFEPARPTPSADDELPWVERYRPEHNSFELGVAFGPFLPPSNHGLINDEILTESEGMYYQGYNATSATFDLRAAYYPRGFLGFEIEGGFAPTHTVELDERADLYYARGHAVLQFMRWSGTPYVFVGGGMLGTAGALGSDVDPAVHFGAGGKFFLTDRILLRIDLRDVIAAGYEAPVSHYIQVSFGVSVRLTAGKRRGARQGARTARLKGHVGRASGG